LVVGGYGNSGALISTGLYDPSPSATANPWTADATLHDPRGDHTSVTLNDGRVLVTGGTDSAYNLVASTEIYDPSPTPPATPTWILSGNLNYPRSYNAISLLADGRVLVAGGDTATGTTSTAEIFDPTVSTNGIAGTWTPTALMAYARNSATATLLLNGKVLVAGGYDANAALVLPCELYDTTTHKWTITGSLNNGRFYHSATLLTSGKVLLVGGGADNTAFLATAELYDPATETWTLTGPLASSRFNHTATLLTVSTGSDYGKVLVVGGLDNAGVALMSTELYDPVAVVNGVTGSWTTTSSLVDARDNFTSTLIPLTDSSHPNGRVLSVGGYGITSILNSYELYW
jgi:WD40 repeat protein